MFCMMCGEPIPEDGSFCMMCGTRASTQYLHSVKQHNQKNLKKKKSRKISSSLKTLIIVLMSIVVVALIAFVLLSTLDVLSIGSMSADEENIISFDKSSNNDLVTFCAAIEGDYNFTLEYMNTFEYK